MSIKINKKAKDKIKGKTLSQDKGSEAYDKKNSMGYL